MRIYLAGTVGLEVGDRLADDWGGVGRQGRLLFACLAANHPRPVPRDDLADVLWAGEPPSTWQKGLGVVASRLRAFLVDLGVGGPEVLACSFNCYQLLLPTETWIDVDAARLAVEEAEAALSRADWGTAVAAASAAAPIARREFLPGEAGLWVEARREELRDLLLRALECHALAAIRTGRLTDALTAASEIVTVAPFRETGYLALMNSHRARGNRAEALKVYERCRRLLVEELGTDPSPALEQCYMELLTDSEPSEANGEVAGAPDLSASMPARPASDSYRRSLLVSDDVTAFVGREPELSTLHDRWELAKAGGRSLVWLSGEPGIGKTRLLSELAISAVADGGIVLAGRCDEQPLAAYEPFAHALTTLTAVCGAGLEARVRSWPELARLMPQLSAMADDVTPWTVGSEDQRYRLFEAVATVLADATAMSPVLLLLDDLHWADQPTLLLLRHLVRNPDLKGMMIVAAYRDTDLTATSPLALALADLRRDRQGDRLHLDGLDATAVATMASSVAGGDGEVARFTAALHHQTAGNPFFVEEVLRHLTDMGILERGAPPSTTVLAELGLPESIKEVIGRRVSQLSEAANAALRLAAVIGRQFDLRLLCAVADIDELTLLDCIEEAEAAGLVAEVNNGTEAYRFRHELVRQTLYAGLSTVRRRRLHAAVGEAIERLYESDLESHLSQLAHHFVEAESPTAFTKVWRYARDAGEQALVDLAYEEAAHHFLQAVEVLESIDAAGSDLCDALLLLGEAQWKSGETAASKATYERAAALARNDADAPRLARAALGYGTGLGGYVHSVRADGVLVGLLEEALDALGSRRSALRVRVLATLAVELYYTPFAARRFLLAEEAVRSAETVDNPAVALMARHARAWATLGPDRPIEERIADCAEIVRRAELLGDRSVQYQGHFLAQMAHLENGDVVAADSEMARAAAVADDLRIPGYQPWLKAYRAMRATLSGRYDEGDALADEALEEAVAYLSDPEATSTILTSQLVAQRIFRGGVEPFVAYVEQLAADNPQHPMIATFVPFAYRELGRTDDVRWSFERVMDGGLDAIPRDANWLLGMWALALSCSFIGDEVRARELYDVMAPFERRWVSAAVSICLGPASIALGALATTIGSYDRAARHFERALEETAAAAAPGLLAHARHEYALMFIARANEGDADEARALLADARRTADELGMASLLAMIDDTRITTVVAR